MGKDYATPREGEIGQVQIKNKRQAATVGMGMTNTMLSFQVVRVNARTNDGWRPNIPSVTYSPPLDGVQMDA